MSVPAAGLLQCPGGLLGCARCWRSWGRDTHPGSSVAQRDSPQAGWFTQLLRWLGPALSLPSRGLVFPDVSSERHPHGPSSGPALRGPKLRHLPLGQRPLCLCPASRAHHRNQRPTVRFFRRHSAHQPYSKIGAWRTYRVHGQV